MAGKYPDSLDATSYLYKDQLSVRAGLQNVLQIFVTNAANVFLLEVSSEYPILMGKCQITKRVRKKRPPPHIRPSVRPPPRFVHNFCVKNDVKFPAFMCEKVASKQSRILMKVCSTTNRIQSMSLFFFSKKNVF